MKLQPRGPVLLVKMSPSEPIAGQFLDPCSSEPLWDPTDPTQREAKI
jgi:hypothetical protein